jgi:hypothetical protein
VELHLVLQIPLEPIAVGQRAVVDGLIRGLLSNIYKKENTTNGDESRSPWRSRSARRAVEPCVGGARSVCLDKMP